MLGYGGVVYGCFVVILSRWCGVWWCDGKVVGVRWWCGVWWCERKVVVWVW